MRNDEQALLKSFDIKEVISDIKGIGEVAFYLFGYYGNDTLHSCSARAA